MTEAEKAYQYFVIAVPENEEQAKAYFWARKALQSTLTQPNEPLTLDELREMDGEPVWFDTIKRWGIVIVRSAEVSVLTKSGEFDVTRLKFYRRPPEGEEDT